MADPAADTYRIAVRRIPEGGGGSVEVHDRLAEGTVVHTHGPRNAFPLTVPGRGSPARRFRFIAGGIGITPILPMLGLAHRLGVDWSMIYAGRTRDSLPFLDEVQRGPACRSAPTTSAEYPRPQTCSATARRARRSTRAVPHRC